MKIYSVYDPEFSNYGKIVEGYDFSELLKVLDEVSPMPTEGTEYVAKQPELMALPVAKELSENEFGGMPVELGWCNGVNTVMNGLEYHRCSELNLGTTDLIFLLAKREDMVNGRLDSSCVKAFLCPKGVMVETFATTLHYAPCSTRKNQGFKMLVVLADGTNGPKPAITIKNEEDKLLAGANKWLLAHPDSPEAKAGATVAIDGPNIDIYDILPE
ncbi:MAG: DUF4867 family protein [Lachnospiraceae bacterium]|nr:DUF4867 family protein [Lachnospiraceae bacterium]